MTARAAPGIDLAATRGEVLFTSGRFVLGTFRCGISDPRWTQENSVDDGFNIVFPSEPVQITQSGTQRLLGDRNHVMFYDLGRTFRREPASPAGDVCTFVVVDEGYLRRTAETTGLDVPPGPFSFPSHYTPAPAALYLASRVVIHRVASGRLAGNEADARLGDVVRGVMSGLARPGGRGAGAAAPRVRPEHVRLVEEVKLRLADLPQSAKLAELAEAAAVSPFHLARVFRRCTGFTLHGYRDQLRLRFCLDSLIARAASVSELAYAAGYSSPSHLSDNFRRVFGFPPSRTMEVVCGSGG